MTTAVIFIPIAYFQVAYNTIPPTCHKGSFHQSTITKKRVDRCKGKCIIKIGEVIIFIRLKIGFHFPLFVYSPHFVFILVFLFLSIFNIYAHLWSTWLPIQHTYTLFERYSPLATYSIRTCTWWKTFSHHLNAKKSSWCSPNQVLV